MKIRMFSLLLALVMMLLCGCAAAPEEAAATVAATTYPVYQFTAAIAAGTPLTVERVITEPVSCVHDHTLSVNQMKTLRRCGVVVASGLGLEDFLEDALPEVPVIDASYGIEALCTGHDHEHEEHNHDHGDYDPHLWLDPAKAVQMAQNICDGLCRTYPEYDGVFRTNAEALYRELEALAAYGQTQLADLSCRTLVTFHDGFAYFAAGFDLELGAAMEVEAGSEPSARELEEIVRLVEELQVPAIFVEESGSSSAAGIIAGETGAAVYTLDMGMAERDYFAAMRYNIDTIREALK